jgi:hypothetical protein
MKGNLYELSEEYIRNEEFFLKFFGFRIRFDLALLDPYTLITKLVQLLTLNFSSFSLCFPTLLVTTG